MKRFWKIFGITLGSLIGVVLVAAAVLVYVVFTPKRLTPIVSNVLDNYISCPYEIGDVELTFFSTLPEFGLRAKGILIVNPMEGAQSDTVLAAPTVVARIDIMRLLKDGIIDIHEATLDDVALNAYINPEGMANFDVLTLPQDTTPEDTTSDSFIKGVDIHDMAIHLRSTALTLCDEKDTISAAVFDSDFQLAASRRNDNRLSGNLVVALPSLSASYKGTSYATRAAIRLELPFDMDLQMDALNLRKADIHLNDAQLALNQFKVDINGDATYSDSINMDLQLSTNRWNINEVLELIPAELFTMPEDIHVAGNLTLTGARVHGVLNDSVLPLVDANLVLTDAEGSIASLPYLLENVEANVDAHINLNDSTASSATINSFSCTTKNSQATGTGVVSALLGDMMLDIHLDVDVDLPDAQYFLPDNMHLQGRARGPLELKMRLDDLTNVQLTKGIITGDLDIKPFAAQLDSMDARTSNAHFAFRIPNSRPAEKAENSRQQKINNSRRQHVGWMEGCLRFANLHFGMPDGTKADFGDTDMDIQLSDVTLTTDIICADLDVQTDTLLAITSLTDSVGRTQPVRAGLGKANLCGYMEYDFLDTTHIPTLSCTFDVDRLNAQYDTITIAANHPKGNATITGGRRDKTQPKLFLSLALTDLKAKMGSYLSATGASLALKASARHTTDQSNILLEWRPKLDFDVRSFRANMQGVDPTIMVPQITFTYSNKELLIDTAMVNLGKSDFALSGQLTNIGPWLQDEGLLQGNFNLSSNHADIDELMAITNGIGADGSEELTLEEETAAQQAGKGEMDPYMVPKGMDVTLNTNIRSARALGQDARNLGGMIYVRDGVLILEEVGFICKAASLKLTAMYKTPRKNHLFVGLDYHMTDIDIAELVDMVPQVDTLLPMLRSFKGAANFHLAAESYMNGYYELKPSTTRGACSIDAKDLTLLDGETFTKIARLLTFKKSTENKIDSISAEITLRKKEIEVYPFLVTMDKWMAAVGGQHNLDMSFNYHVSLLNPVYLGVDVKGTFDDLDIDLAKCRYAKDFKPVFTKKVDTESADVRKLVRDALTQGYNK